MFGGKTTMACKHTLFNIIDLVWYLFWNSLVLSMHVFVQSSKGGD